MISNEDKGAIISYGTYTAVGVTGTSYSLLRDNDMLVDAATTGCSDKLVEFFAVNDGHILIYGIGLIEVVTVIACMATIFRLVMDYRAYRRKRQRALKRTRDND